MKGVYEQEDEGEKGKKEETKMLKGWERRKYENESMERKCIIGSRKEEKKLK